MSELQNHLSNLRQFGKQMRSVIQVAEALEKITSLEGYQAELETNVKDLAEQQAKWREKVDAAIAEASAAKDRAEQVLAEAGHQRDEIIATANAEAATVKAEASSKAAAIITAAEVRAESVRTNTQREIAGSEQRIAQLQSDVDNLGAERKRLEAEIEERQAVLASIKSKLAALAA